MRKENKNTYYVYRFLNKDNEIIYIGKTENIDDRMNVHFGSSGHLPKECYKNVNKIEYITLKTRSNMDIYEINFINKFKPVFNKQYNYDEDIEDLVVLKELPWAEYIKGKLINKKYKTKSINSNITKEKISITRLDIIIFTILKDNNSTQKMNAMSIKEIFELCFDQKYNTLYTDVKKLYNDGYLLFGYKNSNADTYYLSDKAINWLLNEI